MRVKIRIESMRVSHITTRRRPMPRPKSFDPAEVLSKAMCAFWKTGYAATSVSDLTAAMDINKFSLYSAFGGKRELFLAALERYSSQVVTTLLSSLETREPGLDEVRAYFEAIVDGATHVQECRGCLMTNTGVELAVEDAEVRRIVRKHQARLKRAFRRALDRAVERGELLPRASTDLLARHLVAVSQAIALDARTRPRPDEYRGYVAWLMESLDAT